MSFKRLIWIGILTAVLWFLPTALGFAQQGAGAGAGAGGGGFGLANPGSSDTVTERKWIIAGMVTTLGGDPVSGATVVVNPHVPGGTRKTLRTDLQGRFTTDYMLNVNAVSEFRAELEAFKKGSTKSYVVVDMRLADRTHRFPITLWDEDDPTLLPKTELISALSPKIGASVNAAELSPSARKTFSESVGELQDPRRPDRALISLSDVVRRNPSCLPCRTMLGLVQFDSGDWDGAEHNFTAVIDVGEKGGGQGSPEPLIAYGTLESWSHRPGAAAELFLKAIQIAPQNPLALQELGRSQLQLQNWRGADLYLGKALEAGAGPEARFLRARALLAAGSGIAASKEMALYVNGRDVKTLPVFEREVWKLVQDRAKVEEAYAKVRPEDVVASLDDPEHRPAELDGLEPAKDQAPLADIMKAVGKNVEEFFSNFPNTSSVELVRQEKLTSSGTEGKSRDRQFRYLCFAPVQTWGPTFTEYRLPAKGEGEADPQAAQGEGYMLTSGFAATSLLFHPALQPDSVFRFLGRQKLDGRDTFVLAFAQDPAKARSISIFKWGDHSQEVFLRGLAWADAETYQIVRMRTDLLTPLPEVYLATETTDINFVETHFNRPTQGFWLPRDVTVTVEWNGRRMRNVHQYSDFKVFQVDSKQKIAEPNKPGGN